MGMEYSLFPYREVLFHSLKVADVEFRPFYSESTTFFNMDFMAAKLAA
jgi:hypothetical protein